MMRSWMPFEVMVALRFLREGRVQTLLILLAVAVGVGVTVFLSALIQGLQADLIDKTLGSLPHVTVHAPEEKLLPAPPEPGSYAFRILQRPPERLRGIPQWQPTLRSLAGFPRVVEAAPVVSGPAVLTHAASVRAVSLKGVDFRLWNSISHLPNRMRAGEPRTVGATALIGATLADELGMGLGERFRIEGTGGRHDTLAVSGIFDFQNEELNGRLVLVSLPTAQNLLALPGEVTALELTISRIFDAAAVADGIARQTGLKTESWMSANANLLAGLRAQSSSSLIIQVFVAIAVALGISSVLAVAVVQKSREIGILKATGTSTRQILAVFLLQGALLGFAGSVAGCALGAALATLFRNTARNPDGTPRFPVALEPSLFGTAVAIAACVGLVAAALPARRAARLDPAVVIRYG